MPCPSCGQDNPSGSVFCQRCGVQLGHPAGGAVGAMGSNGGVRAAESKGCTRCGAVHGVHMRFCTECGTPLAEPAGSPVAEEGSAIAGTKGEGPSARTAPPPSMDPAQQDEVGPICPRCRGVGDRGATYCKFCGGLYEAGADKGGWTAAGAPAGQPSLPSSADPIGAPAAEPSGVPAAAMPAAPAPEGEPVGPAAEPLRPRPKPQAADVRLVAILKDGTDGQAFPLLGEQNDIGRQEGDVVLSDDPYLSPRHARIRRRGDTFVLQDLDSTNGVYVRIAEPTDLSHGEMILIGQQVLRFERLDDTEEPLGPASVHGVLVFGTPDLPRRVRLIQYTTEGVGRDVYYLHRDETILGRETGDVVFTDDPFLSRRHASITIDPANQRFVLRDLGSSNGTSVRRRGEIALRHGDHFRIGRHLFRFDSRASNGGRRAGS